METKTLKENDSFKTHFDIILSSTIFKVSQQAFSGDKPYFSLTSAVQNRVVNLESILSLVKLSSICDFFFKIFIGSLTVENKCWQNKANCFVLEARSVMGQPYPSLHAALCNFSGH